MAHGRHAMGSRLSVRSATLSILGRASFGGVFTLAIASSGRSHGAFGNSVREYLVVSSV